MARLFAWASPDPNPGQYVETNPPPGSGGVVDVGDPFNTSIRPFGTFWEPGDGAHATWVAANFRVTVAPGQYATAWLEVWDQIADFGTAQSVTVGAVSLDRTAESGAGNQILDGWVYALVPAGYRARTRDDFSGGSAVVVGVHEQVLSA